MIEAIIAIAVLTAANMAAVNGTTPAKAVKTLAITADNLGAATQATHVLIPTNQQERKAASTTLMMGKSRK